MSEKQPATAVKVEEHHESSPAIPLGSVFPSSKIKAHILHDEGVGRLSNKSVEYISACSAAFCEKLIEDSSCAAGSQEKARVVLSLDMVKTCINTTEQYDFLQHSLDSITDKKAPRLGKDKTATKRPSSKSEQPRKKQKQESRSVTKVLGKVDKGVEEAVAQAQNESFNPGGIVLDQEDYD